MRLYTFTVLLCLVSRSSSQQTVLQSLGNHGDRLSDLESKMTAITALAGTLSLDLQRVTKENADLKQKIQALESRPQCGCQTSLQSPVSNSNISTTTTSTSVSSTDVPLPSTSGSIFSSESMMSSPHSVYSVTNHSAVSSTTDPISSTSGPRHSSSQSTTTRSTTIRSTVKPIYRDCNDAFTKGVKTSGALQIQPVGMSATLHVYCQMTSSGGWLVIQRRVRGNVSFNRGWDDYKRGFGEFNGDFYIGNELIHRLTTTWKNSTLYILLRDWSGRTRHAQYTDFWIAEETENYRLNVGAYSGDAGDSFNYRQSGLLRHNHMKFSTPDKDNDPHFLNCARQLNGGWWYNQCYSSNLNGVYLNQPHGHRSMGEMYGDPTLEGTGIEWYPWQHKQYSLKFAEMRIQLGY